MLKINKQSITLTKGDDASLNEPKEIKQNPMEQALEFLKNLYLQNKEEADKALKDFEERQAKYKEARKWIMTS